MSELSLEEKLSEIGFKVIEDEKTGSHIRHDNFSFNKFGDEIKYVSQTGEHLTDKKCIKIYVRFKQSSAEENILNVIKSLAELIRNNEIAVKYNERGLILDKGPSLFDLGDDDVPSGYHLCIYIPYSKKNTLEIVIRKVIELPPYKEIKILIGKTLFHKYIPLKEEDLKEIVHHYEHILKFRMRSERREIEEYNKYNETLQSYEQEIKEGSLDGETIKDSILFSLLTNQIFGRRYYEGSLKIEKGGEGYTVILFNYSGRRSIKQLSKGQLLSYISKSIEDCNKYIKEYEEKIKPLEKCLSLIESKNYIEALKMLKDLNILRGTYAETLRIEGNSAYLTGLGIDSFFDTLVKSKEVNDVLTVSYMPSEESKANEIINLVNEIVS